ncbi:hypothetical protein EDB85DRAFT_1977297, partial [Lactarius pseudohatsudake]
LRKNDPNPIDLTSPRRARTLNPKRPSILRTKESSKKESTGKSSPIPPRPSEIRWVNCGSAKNRLWTALVESKGSRPQPVRVEVAVIRARNVPHIKTTFGRNRESFVTIACWAKKQTKKRTKSVHIDASQDFLLFNRIFSAEVPISFLQPHFCCSRTWEWTWTLELGYLWHSRQMGSGSSQRLY